MGCKCNNLTEIYFIGLSLYFLIELKYPLRIHNLMPGYKQVEYLLHSLHVNEITVVSFYFIGCMQQLLHATNYHNCPIRKFAALNSMFDIYAVLSCKWLPNRYFQ